MRSAARPVAAAGIALVILLCRLTAAPVTTLRAQSTYPPVSGREIESRGGDGAPAAPWSGSLNEGFPGGGAPPEFNRTSRPGLQCRTVLRLSPPLGDDGMPLTVQQVLVDTDGMSPLDVGTGYRRTAYQSVLANQPEEVVPPGLAPESRGLPGQEALPPPGGEFRGTVEPLFDEIVEGGYVMPATVPRPGFFRRLGSALRRSRERAGIGRERVALAPFEIEASQPSNNLLMRFESVYGLQYPDRSEYFWARTSALSRGKGPPLIEKSVDYQDLRFRMEAGGAKFSATTEVYLRNLNPVVNGNTGGFGDMNVATKLVMVDGADWQISQVFRTYILTGAVNKGLGVGHVSLEPGVLLRYRQSDLTYWHGELKFWWPIAGDFEQAGEVLKYGFGASHLLYDSDRFAIMPTAEFGGLIFLDGLKTLYPSGVAAPVDGDFVINFFPGVRIVQDTGGDLGLLEWGAGGGFTIGSNGWYNGLLRVDMRLTY